MEQTIGGTVQDTIALERMTSPEVAAALAEGYTTVIVPAGAIEQHGPHLPMFMDAEHGDVLGLEVATRLGNALVAPTIRVGCSEHHMSFRGTVSLSQDTFLSVCRDYCDSLSRHGFRRICFMPTHGGNFRPLQDGLADLNEVVGAGCSVLAYTDLMEVIETWSAVAEAQVGLGDRVGGHADLAETSVMLAMHPGLVRQDLATVGYVPDPDPEARAELVDRIIAGGFAAVTPNGILGDARGATAELGKAMVSALADVVTESFRE